MVQLAAKLAKSIAQKIADNKKKPAIAAAPKPLKPFQGNGHRLDDDEPSTKVIKSITKQSKKVKKKSTVRTKGMVPTLVA